MGFRSTKNSTKAKPEQSPACAATNSNRVWVKQSAVDTANKKLPKAPTIHRRQTGSFANNQSNSSVASSSSGGGSDSFGNRHLTWGWKAADMVESSNGQVVIRLLQQDPLQPEASPRTITLPADALTSGDLVLTNEYQMDTDGNPSVPHDLITLTHLHEPAVVESLQHRYARGQIYTNTGPVLLALNPFQNLRGVYGESIQKKYWEKAEQNLRTELPPHVYAIADESFRSMMRKLEDLRTGKVPNGNSSQSILVSGESGAGKTVTTKFVMKYLAALSHRSAAIHSPVKRAYAKVQENRQKSQEDLSSAARPSKNRWQTPQRSTAQPSWAVKPSQKSGRGVGGLSQHSRSGSDLAGVSKFGSNGSIESQVLQSNPILESFGNARTVRNDNSSRFGKFIEIQFSENGKLVGAQIETYLLEKVRLVTQAPGERNYHIFLEMLSGAVSANELAQFYIAPTARPDDFRITASGTYDRRDGVSDRETFSDLLSAMNTMKFQKDEIHSILAVTAAILHASNLTFIELPDDCSELDSTNVHLQPVCNLLGVLPEELNEALCYYTITAGRSTLKRSLSLAKAERGLEAMMKATYGGLFDYLVRRINDSISFKEPPAPQDDESATGEQLKVERPASSIGVLDIFGFESFAKNSFEQLCINYCNEALQQQFNAFVLKNEQAEYEREGIEWSFIEFPENQDVLDLIEKRGTGVLSILDDQCRAPGPSDKAFAMNVYNTCKAQTRFSASRKQTASLQFSINHYAGPVEYSTDGFTEKNRDELPKEATELLKNSEFPFLQEIAFILENCHEDPMERSGVTASVKKLHRADSAVGRPTVGGQFRKQLRNLRGKIDLTSPHYIRCLKPNDMLVPDHFDTAIVAEQLRCGGILEAVRVARAGFTQHYPHEDFVRRYRSLAWKELSKKCVPSSSSFGWNGGAVKPKKSIPTGGGFRSGYVQNIQQPKVEPKREMTDTEKKVICKNLIRILVRKVQHQIEGDGEPTNEEAEPAPAAKAKTYSYQTPSASVPWARNTSSSRKSVPSSGSTSFSSHLPPAPRHSTGQPKLSPWDVEKRDTASSSVPSTPSSSSSTWKRGSLSSADFAKVGIQMGKTKVFLRHKAFEVLERIRSQEQTKAATKLNALFRCYLARMAYLPYRNAFRSEVKDRRMMFSEDYEEKKEDYGDHGRTSSGSYQRFRSAISNHSGGAFAAGSLVDKWMESKIRDAIHNPVPRHEWGKAAPSCQGDFKWVLSDGIWVMNYSSSN